MSNELLGAHRNGGIGTATSHLALLFATAGHSVTLFYVGYNPLDLLDRWAVFYRSCKIEVLHFPGGPARIAPSWVKLPTEIFEQLRGREFELILFQEWLALGHACVVAKRAGLAFRETTLATITHSSTPWILEANRTFLSSDVHLALNHMEKQSIELSDAVVSPSRYLCNWMTDAGWRLPSDVSVIPYFLDGPELLGAKPSLLNSKKKMSSGVRKPYHLAFFGRFEERKGIAIFLAAIASNKLREFEFHVTFLGRDATMTSANIKDFVLKHRPELYNRFTIVSDMSSDQAQEYLKTTNAVAVIPSLLDNSPCVIYESLKLGIPFVASATGGIPELLHPDDVSRCLFSPNTSALTQKLQELLSSDSWDVARAAHNSQQIEERWLDWVVRHKSPAAVPYIAPKRIDVTVIISHYERPRFLEQNLRALCVQSEPLFNAIIVDDGSQSVEAKEFLDRAERGFGGRAFTVVRKENGYVGAARNAGVRHSETPYVIFMDDDNIAFPNMVETFLCAAQVSGADILTCQMQAFHDAFGEPDPIELITGERWGFSGGPVALGALRNCFGDATGIYKRTVFDTQEFHELPGVTHEDWLLHFEACIKGYVLLSLPLPLFWYRITPDSMVRTTNRYMNVQIVARSMKKLIHPQMWPLVDYVVSGSEPFKVL